MKFPTSIEFSSFFLFFFMILTFCSVTTTDLIAAPSIYDYQEGKVYLQNGEIITALVSKVDSSTPYVLCKKNETDKPTKYGKEEIDHIEYIFKDGIARYDLVYVNSKNTRSLWGELIVDGPVKLYGMYSVTQHESRLGTAKLVSTVGNYTWFGKRSNEHAEILAINVEGPVAKMGYENSFRKLSGKYFSDYSELASDLKDKKGYKIEDLVSIVERYNKWFQKKNE